jgi:threonine/homoserine/homoserine lactone efflux protein
MTPSLPFLMSGILFGLAAGISPGPLLTLVISETLRHNRKAGIRVALAPIVTDLPIVLLSVFILTRLSNYNWPLGILSMLGGLFIGYLAYESITIKGVELNLEDARAQSLRKGIIANFLSPHPYLFWISVGAPTTLRAYSVNLPSAILFVLGFYICLIGSKITVALIVDKSKIFLTSKVYIYIIKILGLVLLIFAVMFVKEGLSLLFHF